MQVLNKTTSVQRFPDGHGNHLVLQSGHMENTDTGLILIPGVNTVPDFMMERVKKCLGSVRWSRHAQFIKVEGDKEVPVEPTVKTAKLPAPDMIGIIKVENNEKKLIGYANDENLRDASRKTVTEAIEKRMAALSKKKGKDGEHDQG